MAADSAGFGVLELYVARHAEAARTGGVEGRPITEAGREDARRMGRALAAAGVRIAAVWHSGKLRARQTAELLAGAVGFRGELEVRSDLDPHSDPSSVLEAVLEARGPVLLVGHLPHLERLASKLLTGNENAGVVEVAAGGVLRFVSADRERWRLIWYAPPSLLRGDPRPEA
jgi:phosphohistidine phosphatase